MVRKLKFPDFLKFKRRKPLDFCLFVLTWLAILATVAVMAFIIGYVLVNGVPYLTPSLFAFQFTMENQSLFPALVGTLMMVGLSLILAVPLGVFSAIYLQEYAKRGSRFVKVVRLTTETLAGIPSIVYGLFGFLFFGGVLGWGLSLMSGTFTVSIMILPLIMRTTEESIKAVPDTYREGSFGLGAGRLRTVVRIVLPAAMPGILAGIILAIGRIVGETAAIIFTLGNVARIPGGLFDTGRTLSAHMYQLAREGTHPGEAHATAAVLLIVVIIINALSSRIARLIKSS
ncbi:MAG: phosphate ABC transporter permease PstA [Oscillospiraceae bacterium]|nr:phosphate ABC transporter permease PstA [Oscillospiraceae bacterium]